MTERIDDILREMFDSQALWSPCPAEVVSFNSALQTCDARPDLQVDGTPAPVVKDVPVLMPSGGGWQIDLHLQAGDHVLLIFCAVSPALWRSGSNAEQESRRPQFGDVVALPCLARSAGKTAGTPAGVTIKNDAGTVGIEMTATGTKITGNLTVTGTVDATAITPATRVGVSTHVHTLNIPGNVTLTPTPGT